jgi:hypothetical protein
MNIYFYLVSIATNNRVIIIICGIFLEGLKKTRKPLVRTAGLSAEKIRQAC